MPDTRTTGLLGYYPEMGDAKPEADIEANLGHYGKHWYLTTPLTLKGRGIVHLETLQPHSLTPQAQHKVGWHRYRVTVAAFERLESQYRISTEFLL